MGLCFFLYFPGESCLNGKTGNTSRASSMASTTASTMFVCRVCSKSFSSAERLRRHESRHFFRPVSTNSPRRMRNFRVRVSGRKFDCSECDAAFFTVPARTRHQRRHFRSRDYGPAVEDWSPGRLRQKHCVERDTYFTCQLCGKVFGYRPCLTAHMHSHGFTTSALIEV